MDYYKFAENIPAGVTYFAPQTNNGLLLCVGAATGNNSSVFDVVHKTPSGTTAWFRYKLRFSNLPSCPIFFTPCAAAGVSFSTSVGSTSVLRIV